MDSGSYGKSVKHASPIGFHLTGIVKVKIRFLITALKSARSFYSVDQDPPT